MPGTVLSKIRQIILFCSHDAPTKDTTLYLLFLNKMKLKGIKFLDLLVLIFEFLF